MNLPLYMYQLLPDWLDSDVLSLMKRSTGVTDNVVDDMMLLMRDNEMSDHFSKSDNYAKHGLVRKDLAISFLQLTNRNINIIDNLAYFGINDMLVIVKKEFPEIKGTAMAFDGAAKNGHDSTLILLKREFPEITGTSYAFDYAAMKGHDSTLLLLKREFPEIRGTRWAFDGAAANGHDHTLLLLKREFPEIQGTLDAFEWAKRNGHDSTLMLLQREFPELCPR